jgi:hypothetical protein
MGLATQPLYDMALAEVGGGSGNSRFSTAFINAVNFAIDELADEIDSATRFAHISSVNSTISGIDADRGYIIYAGIIYYLMRMGQRSSDPKVATLVFNDSKNRWDEGKGNYWMRRLNDCQAVTTSDITKLGSVTT